MFWIGRFAVVSLQSVGRGLIFFNAKGTVVEVGDRVAVAALVVGCGLAVAASARVGAGGGTSVSRVKEVIGVSVLQVQARVRGMIERRVASRFMFLLYSDKMNLA